MVLSAREKSGIILLSGGVITAILEGPVKLSRVERVFSCYCCFENREIQMKVKKIHIIL